MGNIEAHSISGCLTKYLIGCVGILVGLISVVIFTTVTIKPAKAEAAGTNLGLNITEVLSLGVTKPKGLSSPGLTTQSIDPDVDKDLTNCDNSNPDTIKLTITATKSFSSSCQTLTIDTNGPGYSLSISANNGVDNTSNLIHSSSSLNPRPNIPSTASPISNPAKLTTNSWGFAVTSSNLSLAGTPIANFDSYGDYAANNQNNKYAGLPTTNTELYTTDQYLSQADSFSFYYGANVAMTQAAGTYATTVTYTVIAEPLPEPAIYEFAYVGEAQEFTAPQSGSYKVELWGASGQSRNLFTGGAGAYTSGDIYFEKNTTFYIYIGQLGDNSLTTYNGGGLGYRGSSTCLTQGGSGGGASDLRLSSGLWDNLASTVSRIMVSAGGGGGSGSGTDSNVLNGTPAGGLSSSASGGYGGKIATQTAGAPICDQTHDGEGGNFGCGGGGALYCGGGGGSGYYGGGGGCSGANRAGSGSGGSSFISGHTGAVAIKDPSTTGGTPTPKDGCTTGTSDNTCSIHYSGKVFTNTVMIDGAGYAWTNVKGAQTEMPNPTGGFYPLGQGHTGNGFARITYLGY